MFFSKGFFIGGKDTREDIYFSHWGTCSNSACVYQVWLAVEKMVWAENIRRLPLCSITNTRSHRNLQTDNNVLFFLLRINGELHGALGVVLLHNFSSLTYDRSMFEISPMARLRSPQSSEISGDHAFDLQNNQDFNPEKRLRAGSRRG